MNNGSDKKAASHSPRFGGPMGGRGMGGFGAGVKAKNFRGAMKKLLGYIGRHLALVMFVCLLAAASAVFMIIGPKILGRATDTLFEGIMAKISGTGDIDFAGVGETLLFLCGLYAVSALLNYLQGFVMSSVTAKVTYRLRVDIMDKIHRLPLGYYDKTTHGDILSRITNDVDTISQTLNQSVTQVISSVTSLIGTVVMMFSISVPLTFVSLCILPLSMVSVVSVIKSSQKHFKRQQDYLGSVNGHVEEMFGAHVIVKAFGGEKASCETFEGHNGELYKAAWKANFLSGLIMPITGFIGNIGYVVICVIGGAFAAGGAITVGDIQAFIQYVRSFTQPISQIANISNVLQQTAAAAERVFEFLGEAEEIPDEKGAFALASEKDAPALAPKVEAEGSVGFNRVAFGYTPDKLVIRDFSASVKSGQKIAIVGPTGAGKTTIVKLLMRFYDVSAGAITVDGRDIRLYRRDSLRSLFGMVLQDTWLFGGTIADNIRYGKLDATDAEVERAATAAQADRFIRTLPDGYNMVLNEEADNISQGQKQLITIARAILADPDILILDEATSSVDTRTEIMIQKAMDNLTAGRTSFVIAHRLSTIRGADLIFVMRDGDIVEQGAHPDLLARNGFYASLYNSQFEPETAVQG